MRHALAAALLVALAAAASAQSPAEPVVLAPGHPDLDVAAVTPETGVVLVQQTGEGGGPLGSVRDDRALDGGVLAVVTSTAVGMAGPPLRDSTRMAWPSLAPLDQTVETDGLFGRAAWSADSVAGVWGPVAGPQPLAFGLERPVFAPAALPLVVRALPLDRTGYRAVVPLFSVRDRFQEATLTVAGPETITLDDGRTVDVVAVDQEGGGGLTRGFPQRHYVDPETRALVRSELSAMGMTIQMDPLPAEVAATVRPLRSRLGLQAVALVPGHPDLRVGELALAETESEMRWALPEREPLWQIAETADVQDGVATVTMEAEAAGSPTVIRTTTRMAWPSLAPLSHRSVTAREDGESASSLDFDGLRVTGVYGEGQPLDLELRAPVFGPRSVALVARALPFRAGYLATLSTFTAGDRLQEHTLLVVGRETVETPGGPVEAWVVEHDGEGPTRRYAVDPDTRALLSTTYSPRPGAVVETVTL